MPVKFEHRFPDDILRIIAAFADVGEQISPAEADYMWTKFSEGRGSGWMHLAGYDIVHELVDDGLFEFAEDVDSPTSEFTPPLFTNGLRP